MSRKRAVRDATQGARRVLLLVADMLLVIVAGAFAVSCVVLITRGRSPEAIGSALCLAYCHRTLAGRRI